VDLYPLSHSCIAKEPSMPNDHEGSMLVEQEQIALQSILARLGTNGRGDLLPVLLEAQSILGYLPEPMVAEIGLDMRIPQAEIFGVIEFYSMLYSEPMCREVLRVCASPMCAVQGGLDHYRKLQPMQSEAGGEIFAHRSLEAATCLGLCDHAPAALNGSQAVSIQPVQDHGEATFDLKPVPASFVDGSPRWLTQRMGMDPTDIQAYQSKGGFSGLQRAIEEIAPAEVIQEIKISGLSGRGGAAFPTGLKWELTASSDDPERFLVCNADESEPGTFKDRLLLEGDPYSVIEGMILAAYAIQACRGYLFVRGEYPNAQSILTEAIHNAREGGFLGDKVLGSEFSFDIELRSGAGAYICGEETALFEAIEGRRGYPRLKPPFPTTHGLFGKPTVINNVETLAAVSWIVANGSKAFRAVGTADSPGTKLFCLSGDVQQPGVYEVPFGITLADLGLQVPSPHLNTCVCDSALKTCDQPGSLWDQVSYSSSIKAGI
jgi:NADH-quinone oxidoreductase subunit F